MLPRVGAGTRGGELGVGHVQEGRVEGFALLRGGFGLVEEVVVGDAGHLLREGLAEGGAERDGVGGVRGDRLDGLATLIVLHGLECGLVGH